jgi:DNA polymerase-1
MSDKKLFLFDAYALIFRAYYAFINHPIRNSKGMNTSAIFGFTNTIDEIIRKEKPTHIAVVFDPPPPTFRHEIFKEYKATRLKTPEEIKSSVPYIKDIIRGFNINVIEVTGYEADDIIGTLAKRAEKEGFKTYMMTSDKDYAQLVSDNIFIYKPRRSGGDVEIIGVNEVKESFKVSKPGNVIDVLALWGDSTDNIPGVPGIGEKTAKGLIEKYNDLEKIYEHIDELKGQQKENILKYKQQVDLSKKLVTIVVDAPVDININDLAVKEPDRNSLAKVFKELEFRTLAARILNVEDISGSDGSAAVQQDLFQSGGTSTFSQKSADMDNITSVRHKYHLADTKDKRAELINKLSNLKEFSFDTETTGLDVYKSELVGMSFSNKKNEAYYVPVPANQNEARSVASEFRKVFSDERIKKIGQNIKYDMQVLSNYDIEVKGYLFDTMIAHYLIQPDLKHNLEYLAANYLNYNPVSIEELIGKKGKNQLSMRSVDIDVISEYAGEDADLTWQLYKILADELKKNGMTELAERIEMPLIRVLADMENAGFRLNTKDLDKYAKELRGQIINIEKEIYALAGIEFNISSPKQLGEILFEKLNISGGTQKTKTKQYSTSEEVLVRLKDKHDIIGKVLDYRALKKLLSTYVEALPKLIHQNTGKIHTSFEQAWVTTGRLSSKNPNLQNIPIREERGREIRKSFVASDKDHVLLSADYSQIELRLMAHLSKDANMIEAFRNNEDIHSSTAGKIYNISPENVTAEMRRKAKTANFGIIYGISAFGLSQRLNISRSEAKKLIDSYFNSYGRVKEYMEKSIEMAKEKGYAETIFGRRRYLKDINSANALIRGMAERNAINTPLQGSAADIIKLAMVNIHKRLSGRYRTRMILQVHDELIFDVYRPELDEIKNLVKYEMENAVSLEIPITTDIGVGENWLEAH